MDKVRRSWKSFLTKENMIVLTLLGILFLVIALPVGEKKEEKTEQKSGLSETKKDLLQTKAIAEQENENGMTGLEQRLAAFLSCMEGAGEVKVLITFSASEEQVVEKEGVYSGWQGNAADPSDQGGKEQTLQTVYVTEADGTKTPYIKKVLAARVEGVTVLAQGGNLPEIQKLITEMIEALFGIEPHKIRVAKMK